MSAEAGRMGREDEMKEGESRVEARRITCTHVTSWVSCHISYVLHMHKTRSIHCYLAYTTRAGYVHKVKCFVAS